MRHLENATSSSDDEFRRDYNKDSSSDASDVACETAKFNVSQGASHQQMLVSSSLPKTIQKNSEGIYSLFCKKSMVFETSLIITNKSLKKASFDLNAGH